MREASAIRADGRRRAIACEDRRDIGLDPDAPPVRDPSQSRAMAQSGYYNARMSSVADELIDARKAIAELNKRLQIATAHARSADIRAETIQRQWDAARLQRERAKAAYPDARTTIATLQAALDVAHQRIRELETTCAATNERMAAILEHADRIQIQREIGRYEREQTA